MMLVTVDPMARTAGMLSIPRDLWVEIPGFEHNRINTAYFLGESYNLPGGGPALAMKTVESLLGVPVSYFAVIEFSAFERMIDEIGGIDVLVPERVKISPLGRRSRWLDAKAYHLDGPESPGLRPRPQDRRRGFRPRPRGSSRSCWPSATGCSVWT